VRPYGYIRECNRNGVEARVIWSRDNGIKELVWGKIYGQSDLEVIFGKSWSRGEIVVSVPAQCDDTESTADLGAAEGCGFGIGERT
jgi:hypothetical protein